MHDINFVVEENFINICKDRTCMGNLFDVQGGFMSKNINICEQLDDFRAKS